MIGSSRQAAGFNRPSPQTSNVTAFPAPNKGVDTRRAIGSLDPNHCVYSYNLVPSEFGMEVRQGYREWCINLEDTSLVGGVRTMFLYDGIQTIPSDNTLFAVTNEGIWDVTSLNAPVLKLTFTDQTGIAGHGVFCHYTSESGQERLYYADAVNGLFEYLPTLASGTWAQATGITGPDLTKVAYIGVHKQRIWLIEQDSTVGWYLPIASYLGAATEFFFGTQFIHGGKLVALVSWSVDGGTGLDDYLVALSSAGDVVPYQGSDPSIVTGDGAWSSRGVYYIGKLPLGRRLYSEYSGELYLLSSFGLISMSDLLRGVDVRDIASKSLTFPISRVLREELRDSYEELGWEPLFLPNRGYLVINSPKTKSGEDIQYLMSITIEAWGFLRELPAQTFAEWDNNIFFGTEDGRVCVMDVPRDNVLIDQLDVAKDGIPIKFSLLTGYSYADSPGLFKMGQMIRCDFSSKLSVSYRAKAVYDYTIAEQVFSVPSVPPATANLWDVGTWDNILWDSDDLTNVNRLQGTTGMGRSVAIAVQGQSTETTKMLSMDFIWKSGGPV